VVDDAKNLWLKKLQYESVDIVSLEELFERI
jgi:hypothetical protein